MIALLGIDFRVSSFFPFFKYEDIIILCPGLSQVSQNHLGLAFTKSFKDFHGVGRDFIVKSYSFDSMYVVEQYHSTVSCNTSL